MKEGWAFATLTAVLLYGAAARAERPRIAVMQVTGTNVAADLSHRVTVAVREGLLASGADVVDGIPAAATGHGGTPCQGEGCVTAVAKATMAGYVVRGTIEVLGRTYGLRLEMLDGKSGSLLEIREDRCEICTEDEALETASVSASALKAQVFKKRAAVAGLDTATSAEAAPLLIENRVETRAAPGAGAGHRSLGWIGVAAGVVAAAVAAPLIAMHHNGTCDQASGVECPRRYTTQTGGIAVAIGGGLAIAVGVLMLTGTF
ncbi:MAG TPA: hypothetical protein VFH73_13400 [Polyangia bacterium]|jgi:hypothetical protein|nr:hypothetical protein [Polyangia bacterium]